MTVSIVTVREKFLRLQDEIVSTLSILDDETHFHGKDLEASGGGLSRPRVLSDGKHIEKAAVQFTHSLGQSLPPAATERNPALEGSPFQATSISVIVHPRNPHVPTTHMNLRFFLIEAEVPVWYFGGGFDLTPYYPYREDVVQWHQNARSACGSDERYRNLKTQCDDYFFLPHRGESRGVGGLFFDDWTEEGFESSYTFISGIGDAFLLGYKPIFLRRMNTNWNDDEEHWMLLRRGRYAEFNLAIDRGTRYGMQSGRRIESVLASLPPRAVWMYDHQPEPGSREAELILDYLQPRDWLETSAKSKDIDL